MKASIEKRKNGEEGYQFEIKFTRAELADLVLDNHLGVDLGKTVGWLNIYVEKRGG